MEVKEECGVCGIFLKKKDVNSSIVPLSMDLMLSAIQRRGQSGTGMGIFKVNEGKYGKPFLHRKKLLNVDSFFGGDDNYQRGQILDIYKGVSGIGHVRYGTSGSRDNAIDQLQPFLRRHGKRSKRFCFCFNGNLANYSYLRRRMLREGYILDTKVDTEILMNLFALNLNLASIGRRKPDLFEVAGIIVPSSIISIFFFISLILFLILL